MRAVRFLPVGMAVLLTGCGAPAAEAGAEQTDADNSAMPAAQTRAVYVARYAEPVARPGTPPVARPLALFDGTYAVRDDWLVFVMTGGDPALPVFSTRTPVIVHADRVIIAGTVHAFGETVARGGAMRRQDGYAALVEPPPPECRYSLIG
ncbi:hypothetical protein [Croceicoccus hydrothermalis]|uniref:hypothetical protein n=1 Tax=Croceicoccus hydrothermalis TaxID=2867964 RepID=UPI001EFA3404|nr:hypothetical protein [Croceicoccus hydrothermalis]